jgi:hypothetical protein
VLISHHVVEQLLPLLNSNHCTLQANVAFTVGNFASNVGIILSDEWLQRLVTLLQSGNEAVQEYTSYCMKQLCDTRSRGGAESISRLLGLGVLIPLLDLLQSSSQWVLCETLAALFHIASHTSFARPRISSRTSLRHVIAILTSFPDECRLYALKLLKALVPCSHSAICMVEEGVLTAIVPHVCSSNTRFHKIAMDIAYNLAKIGMYQLSPLTLCLS